MNYLNNEISLENVLILIEKYNVTAYEIEKNTSLSAVGVQKIIDKKTKNPNFNTLKTIKSYITNKYENNSTTPPNQENNNNYLVESLKYTIEVQRELIEKLKQELENK